MIDMKFGISSVRIAATNAERINAQLHDAGYFPTNKTGQVTIWFLPESAIELPPEEAVVWAVQERSLTISGVSGYAEVVSTAPIHMDDITVVPKADLELPTHVVDDYDIPF